MLAYRLDDLGWADFEDLCQALLKVTLGFGVEAWGGSGDWGRDAYFDGELPYPTNSPTRGPFLFQAKFVHAANAAGSQPARALLGAIRKECERIKANTAKGGRWNRPPSVYSLVTNSPVSPELRTKITHLLQQVLPSSAHVTIHSGDDVCAWLNAHREVVRSFPQILSLRDLASLLRDCVNAETRQRSEAALQLAEAEAKVFYPTQAYREALEKLHQYSFVVLEGPPEMGKTTIARIIALGQFALGWEVCECRDAKELHASFQASRSQVFVADDFFGRTEYKPERVSVWQEELPYVLPRLDKNHWLLLTSRAHLLAMGKSNLDIGGKHNAFPDLGEVIVNAANLTRNEKARILYRQAKAAGLSVPARTILRDHAPDVVYNRHFTPERIRRLVTDVLPDLACMAMSKDDLEQRLEEALTDPTKQMRLSFRSLPAHHRWMLCSLLDIGERTHYPHDIDYSALPKAYERMCPSDEQLPFETVFTELTEAFVRRTRKEWRDIVEWIHPSCRDLVIEELAIRPSDRRQFLRTCTRSGLEMACSTGGGARGDRNYPLLVNQADWNRFRERAGELFQDDSEILVRIWRAYETSSAVSGLGDPHLVAVEHLRDLLSHQLLPAAPTLLESEEWDSSFDALECFFIACHSLGLDLKFDMAPRWGNFLDAAKGWGHHYRNLWDDEEFPPNAERFLKLLGTRFPEILRDQTAKAHLVEALEAVCALAEEETTNGVPVSDYDREEAERQRTAYEGFAEAFESFASIPPIPSDLSGRLRTLGVRFHSGESRAQHRLRNELEEDSTPSTPTPRAPDTTRDIDLKDLFSDL